ncbi:ATP-binding protein [Alkaliflexus imshenetskii]|uniref:ATP-binding protein n=1 Tax=Alkaliflexus imshenetskii TaxID=286730 RepID=UPI001C54DB49|nr:ATP-binding protein [Alkaliflexus imshenetskii]
MFQRLASLDFIKRNENVIITGLTGVGKSFLAQALGHQACMMEYKVVYAITSRLFKRLKISRMDGTYMNDINKLAKTDVLILDDFGLQAFDKQDRESLMDIIEDRHGKKTTIVASQIPVSVWYDIIGEGTIADAILDRLVNSSHRIDLNGPSLRMGILASE